MLEANNFKALKIGIASPEKIRSWSYGEVIKPEPMKRSLDLREIMNVLVVSIRDLDTRI